MTKDIILWVFRAGIGASILLILLFGRDEIKQMLSEKQADGSLKISVMRTMITLIIVVFLFNWTWYNIAYGQLVGFGWQEVGLFVALLGGKSIQKAVEK